MIPNPGPRTHAPTHRAPPFLARPRSWRAAALGAVLALTACATAGGTIQAQAVEGCYTFEQDEAALSMRLPVGIELTDQTLQGWPAIMERGDVKVAVTLNRDGTADYPFGYWLEEEDGSLEVGYPAGGGIVLTLEPHRRGLAGTARAVGDALRVGEDPVQEIDVRLERTACPR